MIRILSLFILLLAGCAASPSAPDWVLQNPEGYPVERFLVGRGQGGTDGLARDRARADLAKGFEVAIRESSTDELKWQQGTGDQNGLQTRIRRNISARTSQVVRGVRIAETWKQEGGDSYALAVLDRLQAGALLRAELDELDRTTARNIERARNEETLPEQVAAAHNALVAQIARIHPQKMLRIIDLSGQGVPSSYELPKLRNDFEALLDRWMIGIEVEQDAGGNLASMLGSALAATGVRHAEDTSTAEYLLRASLDRDQLKSADGWYWARGTLRVTLVESTTGNLVGSHQWPFKASARQAEMADIRARDMLADLLARELLGVLVDFGDAATSK